MDDYIILIVDSLLFRLDLPFMDAVYWTHEALFGIFSFPSEKRPRCRAAPTPLSRRTSTPVRGLVPPRVCEPGSPADVLTLRDRPDPKLAVVGGEDRPSQSRELRTCWISRLPMFIHEGTEGRRSSGSHTSLHGAAAKTLKN
ncbi:hypothetical protein Q5P01_018755 [Channa striata]|uniref:Uncharacterized protein n=1 Tax=Channa striata TaxID=64152 RepID=A0AA88M5H1_CHASR|nr:hypothetical protein Q5P01_018755 [Channa striata]